jgi:hypothetical protein
MLVDKRREEALKSLYLGIAVQIKETGAMAKLLIIIAYNTCIAVIPSDKTCVEFYRIEELAVHNNNNE